MLLNFHNNQKRRATNSKWSNDQEYFQVVGKYIQGALQLMFGACQ